MDAAAFEGDAGPASENAAGFGAETEALDAVTDLTGRTVAHYRVGDRLGGGAMGSVYRAVDEKSGRMLALKVLLPGADAVMRERFRREARTVSALKHPHIIRTLQAGQTSSTGVIYIAMELVEGAGLAQLLEQQGRLSPRDACVVLKPIAEALAYAHAQGVVHRDVKPSNILLRRVEPDTPGSVRIEGLPYPIVPLLSDFGIARALDAPELTSAGRTIGTPAFMAPEQCAGSGDIDGRADIYSLGAVLYRCLVGRPPYSGSTTQVLHAHVYDPLLIPEETARRLPPEVLALLTRCMMKDPAQRFGTMGLVAAELAYCVSLLPTAEQGAAPDAADDSTMTMAVLPATSLSRGSATRILVPAAHTAPRPVGVVPMRPAPSVTVVRPLNPLPAEHTGERLQKNSKGAMILGAALVVLLLLFGTTVFSSLLPSVFSGKNAAPGTQEMPSAAATATLDAASPASYEPQGTVEQTPSGLAMPASPEPTPGPTPTPTPAPPPAVPLESAWSDAQAFYAERDWAAALDWLIIVRRIDADFERDQVNSMLVTTYMGLATEATVLGDLERALKYLDEALALAPESESVQSMHAATRALADAEVGERTAARILVQQSHADYAATLFDSDPCAAAEQLNAAIRVLSDPALLERQADYQQACATEQSVQVLDEIGGSIIYSAQQGGSNRIFRMPVGDEGATTLLVNDATQPSLAPDGRTLAFFSTRPDAQGLYGFDLSAGRSVDDRSLRFTEAVEDARDAPASWSMQSNRLAFTSTRFGDGRYRVYTTWTDSGDAVETLGYGKDPAWHPSQELIVMNGTDDAGGSPGLWLTAPDGRGRARLTDNGNDQRPTWSPDGRYVVFMSNGRDGNWELYRVDVTDLSIMRLTDHPAQDGLPTISPDGRYVAFMSDRDAYWRIWYVSIDGGEAQPLGRISGELPKWLEHAIQWVK